MPLNQPHFHILVFGHFFHPEYQQHNLIAALARSPLPSHYQAPNGQLCHKGVEVRISQLLKLSPPAVQRDILSPMENS